MTQTFTLREAVPDEVDIIVRHRSMMFLEMGFPPEQVHPHEPATRDWVLAHMQAGDFVTFLAIAENGDIAAGAGLNLSSFMPGPMSPATTRGYIYNVYTEKPYRRMGLATRLVQACCDHCRARGVALVSLHASDDGRPVYEKMGFAASNEMRLRL
jgi:ribosomal protein S18 acetylase RimI-like enzyme